MDKIESEYWICPNHFAVMTQDHSSRDTKTQTTPFLFPFQLKQVLGVTGSPLIMQARDDLPNHKETMPESVTLQCFSRFDLQAMPLQMSAAGVQPWHFFKAIGATCLVLPPPRKKKIPPSTCYSPHQLHCNITFPFITAASMSNFTCMCPS